MLPSMASVSRREEMKRGAGTREREPVPHVSKSGMAFRSLARARSGVAAMGIIQAFRN